MIVLVYLLGVLGGFAVGYQVGKEKMYSGIASVLKYMDINPEDIKKRIKERDGN